MNRVILINWNALKKNMKVFNFTQNIADKNTFDAVCVGWKNYVLMVQRQNAQMSCEEVQGYTSATAYSQWRFYIAWRVLRYWACTWPKFLSWGKSIFRTLCVGLGVRFSGKLWLYTKVVREQLTVQISVFRKKENHG